MLFDPQKSFTNQKSLNVMNIHVSRKSFCKPPPLIPNNQDWPLSSLRIRPSKTQGWKDLKIFLLFRLM